MIFKVVFILMNVVTERKQEYSARTLGATWGIISAVMLPFVVVLICIGWRVLKKRKADEKDEDEYLNIKSRAIDPDESMKINSDDESIPYKKDIAEDSPEPSEPVKVVDSPLQAADPAYGLPYPTYDQQPAAYGQQPQAYGEQPQAYGEQPQVYASQQPGQSRQPWAGETEIN